MTYYAAEIRTIMMEVLFSDEETKSVDLAGGEAPEGAVVVSGIVQKFGFHPERLLKVAPRVKSILEQVVLDEYLEHPGESFLRLCLDRNNEQWGEHPAMEALVALSIGLGWAHYSMPRPVWPMLPGGVPLVRFHFQKDPQLFRRLDLESMRKPRDLEGDDLRRFRVWSSIGGLPAKGGGSAIGKELWERYQIELEDIRKLTPEERIWVLTNAGAEPDTAEIREFLGESASRVTWSGTPIHMA